MTGSPLARIVLVGFMGSGKTSVGRALATALGWRFVDFDAAIEAEEGSTVAELFERRGEARFRDLEAATGRRLLSEDRVVLGTGGGWAAVPGRLESVPEGTATFWLQVSPERAVERAARKPGSRPLLAGEDPLARARALLSEREEAYAAAQWTVDTEHSTVEDVTARILEILQRQHPDARTE